MIGVSANTAGTSQPGGTATPGQGLQEETWSIPIIEAPPGPARTISARDWQRIAKDPAARRGTDRRVRQGHAVRRGDRHRGVPRERRRGRARIQAQVRGLRDEHGAGRDADLLRDVVQGDLFKAETTVEGAQTYETTLGGQLTAPRLKVTKIDLIGHLD